MQTREEPLVAKLNAFEYIDYAKICALFEASMRRLFVFFYQCCEANFKLKRGHLTKQRWGTNLQVRTVG